MHFDDDTYSLQSYAWRLRKLSYLPVGRLGTTARMRYVMDFRYMNRHVPLTRQLPLGLPDNDEIYSYEPPDVLQHGREYSSDEEGDGPSVDKDIFLEVWPYIATWIRQNRRAGNLSVAHDMCAAQYLYILKVAFMRLHFKKIAQRG